MFISLEYMYITGREEKIECGVGDYKLLHDILMSLLLWYT